MSKETLMREITEACAKANPEKFAIPKDLPLPVRYDGMMYYWGANGEMVADFDEGVNDGSGFRIRGWGRIQNEDSQDECAKYIEMAINAYSDVQLSDVLIAIGEPKLYEVGKVLQESKLEKLMRWWNLKLPMHMQEESTLSFIAELLKK